MRRVTALCAAAAIVASNLVVGGAAFARPMHHEQSGYYVIRWDNTGICQIWNEELQYKPMEWPSHYKVVSKPVPTFTDAVNIQLQMREKRSCFL
jgi:hypothetical protein